MRTKGKTSATNKVKDEECLGKYGGFREETGTKTYSHGLMDYAKTLKPRFQLGDLDLPERRKGIQH